MTADAAEIVRLAACCEQATGADREQAKELLWEAFRTIHGAKPPRIPGGSTELDAYLRVSSPFFRLIEAGALLDAAMSLVPEGWRLDHLGEKRITGGCIAVVGSKRDIDADGFGGSAATPALALTAAALRARAASDLSDGEA